MYILTQNGKKEIAKYIEKLKVQRNNILALGLDTAEDTNLPTEEDIISDVNLFGVTEDTYGITYFNGWGVTDNYNSDHPIVLKLGEDIIETN